MNTDSPRSTLSRLRPLLAVLSALLPAACGWVEVPANRGVSPGSARGATPAESAARGGQAGVAGTPRPADGMVTVASGDTVYGFSRRYGVPMQAIIDANGLRPPYMLHVGQRLALPPGEGPVVASGGSSPVVISTTQQPVVISTSPQPGDSWAGQPDAGAPTAVSRSGVTVSGLPPVTGAAPLPSPGETPPPGATLPPPEPSSGLSEVPTSAPPESLVPAPQQEAALTAGSGSGFMWPVNGDVIAEFGPQEKGRHNDGINIAAPRGTPVRAVQSGIVAYAGNELRGFGNLLLVKHEGGWVSAYAHNGALLVQRGDTVSRGQVIARVGDSGGVSAPQLHFELRQGPRAVDPRAHLRQPVS